MGSLILSLLSSLGSAVTGGFQWSLAKLGLNNRASIKDNAIAARDEATKQQVAADFQKADPADLEKDLDP